MEPWLSKNRLVQLWSLLGLSAIGIYLLANHTSTDIALADRMFDFQQGRFPYKHGFFYETVMHGYAKTLLTGIWLTMLIFALLPAHLRPAKLSTAYQTRLRWIVALAATHSSLVTGLKHYMPHACPWNVVRYGGTSPWFPTFPPTRQIWPGIAFRQVMPAAVCGCRPCACSGYHINHAKPCRFFLQVYMQAFCWAGFSKCVAPIFFHTH